MHIRAALIEVAANVDHALAERHPIRRVTPTATKCAPTRRMRRTPIAVRAQRSSNRRAFSLMRRQRWIVRFRPDLEAFEGKQLLSAGLAPAHSQIVNEGSGAAAHSAVIISHGHHTATAVPTTHARRSTQSARHKPAPPGAYGYLGFHPTNTPYQLPYKLIPPFQQVLVQRNQPIPGQVYNVTTIAVKNGTGQTFTAKTGFTVRLTNQGRIPGFPVLTGNEQWKPGQILVFYVLTKKYYPVSFVGGGFQFDLGGRSTTFVPGPAGIFLRLKYNPATFARTLDWIVAYGQGNEVGQGARLGLPNTSIGEIVDARTHRTDFAGNFGTNLSKTQDR
jgi:hypothetical protein